MNEQLTNLHIIVLVNWGFILNSSFWVMRLTDKVKIYLSVLLFCNKCFTTIIFAEIMIVPRSNHSFKQRVASAGFSFIKSAYYILRWHAFLIPIWWTDIWRITQPNKKICWRSNFCKNVWFIICFPVARTECYTKIEIIKNFEVLCLSESWRTKRRSCTCNVYQFYHL